MHLNSKFIDEYENNKNKNCETTSIVVSKAIYIYHIPKLET